MATIQKFKVIKMACFLGLFGAFMGLVFGIISTIILLIVPDVITSLAFIKIWQILIGLPIGYGVLMFIAGLIFIPLVNLTLKIIKGIDLDLDLIESTSAGKSIASIANEKKEIKPVIKYPVKSAKDSSPLPQMTNSKTTAQNPVLKTPIKPTI